MSDSTPDVAVQNEAAPHGYEVTRHGEVTHFADTPNRFASEAEAWEKLESTLKHTEAQIEAFHPRLLQAVRDAQAPGWEVRAASEPLPVITPEPYVEEPLGEDEGGDEYGDIADAPPPYVPPALTDEAPPSEKQIADEENETGHEPK